MEDLDQATSADAASVRDAGGRWAPGQAGNPAGKKPGTRNRSTELRALASEGDAQTVLNALMDLVRAGDRVAIRLATSLMFPKPRDRMINLGLGDGASPVEMLNRTVAL